MNTITPIPAFQDNYIWLVHNNSHALVIDPGETEATANYLQTNNLQLLATLLTHHHRDHTGGAIALQQKLGGMIIAPHNDGIDFATHYCQQGDHFSFPELNAKIEIMALPGHTLGHLGYLLKFNAIDQQHFFCGDTLFSGGCGRLFEGSPQQMWQSLAHIRQLPDTTLLYPAHEYTLSNLRFARHLEPDNQALAEYQQRVAQLRKTNLPSLPCQLRQEKAINPFLRVENNNLIKAAENFCGKTLSDSAQVFYQLRLWKDQF